MADPEAYTLTLEPHPRNPRSRIRVLRGTDDGNPFEVTVPLRIKTVQDAVDWLRPDDVPQDALRQGEFYFIPSTGPHVVAGCYHPDPDHIYREDCGSDEWTAAGSTYRYTVNWRASFSRTHTATTCYSVVKAGYVLFPGRRTLKTHPFTGRPRYFVRGSVTHPEHGTLALPPHDLGEWYEVIPNRAHGPFPVTGYGPNVD